MTDVLVLDGVDLRPKTYKQPEYIPTLYDINKTLDVIKVRGYNGIKGEEHNRMVVFTNFILGRKPLLLTGNRASGKSNVLYVTSVYSSEPITIGKASDKADIRDESINNCSHILIPEINKINNTFVEMLKDFGEGASSIYRYLDEFKSTRTIIIQPKAFITSIADENQGFNSLGAELISRLTVVAMDSSMEQNKRVIEEKLRRAQNPYEKRVITQKNVKECIKYVKDLPNIHEYTFIYLPGNSIRSAIPPIFTDSRRDTDKYLENTYGITLFHYFDRILFTYQNRKHLLVAPADVWYNHIIFNKILIQSALKCNDTESKIIGLLTDKRRQTKEQLTHNIPIKMSASHIHKELLKTGFTHSFPTVRKYCERLSDIGYILKNDEVRPNLFEINTSFTSEYEANIDWKVIVDECKNAVEKIFPEYAKEYIERFCTPPIICKNPFTGEDINILSDNGKVIESEGNVKEKEDGVYEEENIIDKIRQFILKEIEKTENKETSITELIKVISDKYKIEEIEVEEHITFLEKLGELFVKGDVIKRL